MLCPMRRPSAAKMDDAPDLMMSPPQAPSPHAPSDALLLIDQSEAALRAEVRALRAEVSRMRGLGASASITARARNDEGLAIRTLLTISTSRIHDERVPPGTRLWEWDEGILVNANAQRLREWCLTGQLVLPPPRGAVVCTLDPLTLASEPTSTLTDGMLHNAAAGGNVAVMSVLLQHARFPPNARDAVR